MGSNGLMAKRNGKGLLTTTNLFWGGLLLVGAYVGYKYVLPFVQGGNLPEGRVRDTLLGYDNSRGPDPRDHRNQPDSRYPSRINPYLGGGPPPPPGMGMAAPSSGKPTMMMPPPANNQPSAYAVTRNPRFPHPATWEPPGWDRSVDASGRAFPNRATHFPF
jgi:hypothetical protein